MVTVVTPLPMTMVIITGFESNGGEGWRKQLHPKKATGKDYDGRDGSHRADDDGGGGVGWGVRVRD